MDLSPQPNNNLTRVERGRMANDFLYQSLVALRNSGLEGTERILIRLAETHTELSALVAEARNAAKRSG